MILLLFYNAVDKLSAWSITFDLLDILHKRDNFRATSNHMMYTTVSQDLKLKKKIGECVILSIT